MDAQQSDDSPHAQPAVGGRRIVLIEDSADLRGMLRALLQSWGHEVRVAANGREGVELVESCHPEFTLVDIGLPDIDGYEVARQLRAGPLANGGRLVAVTGWDEEEDRQAALAAGFDTHLVKPLDPARLASLLDAPLDQR